MKGLGEASWISEKVRISAREVAVFLMLFTFFMSIPAGVMYSMYAAQATALATDAERIPLHPVQLAHAGDVLPNRHNAGRMETEVVMSFMGDCTLGSDPQFGWEGTLPEEIVKRGYDYGYIFRNVLPILQKDDFSVVNLENTFTHAVTRADKQFVFKAPPEYAKILTLGSVEAVNLSNNHSYDYLDQGYKDTKQSLEAEKIKYFDDEQPLLVEIKGQKFAFLGYRAFVIDNGLLTMLADTVKNLKQQGYITIVTFHWGIESAYYPNEQQKKLAHHVVDHGADLVIGHHPHVLQGVEKYKGKFIFYSLGNFAFGGNTNPREKDTVIAQVAFKFYNNTLDAYGVRVIPSSVSSVAYRNDYQPTMLSGEAGERVLAKLNELSELNFALKSEMIYFPVQ